MLRQCARVRTWLAASCSTPEAECCGDAYSEELVKWQEDGRRLRYLAVEVDPELYSLKLDEAFTAIFCDAGADRQRLNERIRDSELSRRRRQGDHAW